MSNGASMDYKFGPKNQWRRTAWNRIVERLSVPARDALVLYLAGKGDLDRPEALRRGFRDHNLIAVERNARVLRVLRSNGVLAVDGDLLNACLGWSGPQVNVIVADLCCGFTEEVACICMLLAMNPSGCFSNTVVAVNLLKGREKWLDASRDFSGKHRGELAFWHNLSHAWRLAKAQPSPPPEPMFPKHECWLGEYKSGNQVFQSSVWRNCNAFGCFQQFEDYARAISHYITNPSMAEALQRLRSLGKFEFPELKNRIAAIKAHRTMRLQAA